MRNSWFRIAAFILLSTAPANLYACTLVSDDFEDGNDAGWTRICENGSGVDCLFEVSGGTYKLQQVDVNARVWSILDASHGACDFVFQADFKSNSYDKKVIFRADPAGPRYELNLRANPFNDLFLHSPIGDLAHITGISNTVGSWYTIRVQVVGSHIQVWVDDTLKIDLHDTTLVSGAVGVRAHKHGAVCEYDNVQFTPLGLTAVGESSWSYLKEIFR